MSGAGAVLAALALLAGCTVSGEGQAPTPTPGGESASPGPATSSGPPAAAGDDDVVDAPMSWYPAGPPSMEVQTFAAVAPDRVVAVTADVDGQRLVLMRDGSRAEHVIPGGQVVQNVFLVGDDVVFDTAAEVGDDYWITRWAPDAGATTVLHAATGEDAFFSETAVDGTDLYLVAPAEAGTQCVVRMDLTAADPAGSRTTVACGGPGENVGWLKTTNGWLTFLAGTTEQECASMYRVALPAGPAELLTLDGCPDRAIADERWVVWNEPPAPDPNGLNYFTVDLHVQADGAVHELGSGVAGSTVVCDGALYWTWHDPGATQEPAQIRRWRSGGPVEVVHRQSSPADGEDPYSLSGVQCGYGITNFQRFRSGADAGEQLMTDQPLTFTPDLGLARSGT